jgi:hypothetical protein
MRIPIRFLALLTGLILIAAASIGCAATQTTTQPSSEQTTTPTTSGTTQGTTTETTAADLPFKIAVLPTQLQGFSIAGQHVVFLVTFADEGQADGQPVTIAAQADGAQVNVEHATIKSGEVAEITVIPAAASIGHSVAVTFIGQRGSVKEEETISFDVIEGSDDRQEYALELQAKFITWLAQQHPELGITPETAWTGTMVSPQWLVVSHYLFFSDEWEMHIEWHIMIAPYDWARIDLRHRYDATKPSLAFEISSVSGKTTPIAIEVPAQIWR